MTPKPLQPIPYEGYLFEDQPLYFRPRMCPQAYLEKSPMRNQADDQSSPFFPKKMYEQLQTRYSFTPPSTKLYLEFCSGNGHWITEKAALSKDFEQWLAIEKRFDRCKKILSKIRNRKIENLFVICSEAKWFSYHFLDNDSLDGVYINFPDPWPKDKHKHHRLFEPSFLKQVHRVMKQGAFLQLVSDDYNYMQNALAACFAFKNNQGGFDCDIQEGIEKITISEHGYSYFADLWQSKGREIFLTRLIKRSNQESYEPT